MTQNYIFEELAVAGGEMNELIAQKKAQHLTLGTVSVDCYVRLKPIAWSWFYLGTHVTMDRVKAEELLGFGEKLTPLYMVVSEPCSESI